MASRDDDLKFGLSADTDLAAIEAYLSRVEKLSTDAGVKSGKSLGTGIDDQLKRAVGSVDELSKRRDQLGKIQVQLDKALEVEELRADALERQTKQMEHQRALDQLSSKTDPDRIREQVGRERELAAAKKQLDDALEKERAAQGGDAKGATGKTFDLEGTLQAFASGGISGGMSKLFEGVDLKQLLGSVLGAVGAGGGVAGGLGAAAGGVLNRGRDRAGGGSGGGGGGVSMPPEPQPQVGDAQSIGSMVGAGAGGGVEAAMGSGAGELAAMAGPIGMAFVAAQAVAKVGGELAAVPFAVIGGGLGVVDRGLKEMQGPLGPIGAGLALASDGLAALGEGLDKMGLSALAPMVKAAAVIPDTLKSIFETLTSFAAKASPATYKLLTSAVDDAQAVIGHSFIPVVELFTSGIQLAGDVLATILPTSDQVRDALTEVRGELDRVRGELEATLGPLGPQIREGFLTAIRAVGTGIIWAADKLREYGPKIMDVFEDLYELGKLVFGANIWAATEYLTMQFDLLAFGIRFAADQLDLLMNTLRMLGLVAPRAAPVVGTGEAGLASGGGAASSPSSFSDIQAYQAELQRQIFSAASGPTAASVPTIVSSIATDVSTLVRILSWLTPGGLSTAIRDGTIVAAAAPALAGVGEGVGIGVGLPPGVAGGAGSGLADAIRRAIGMGVR